MLLIESFSYVFYNSVPFPEVILQPVNISERDIMREKSIVEKKRERGRKTVRGEGGGGG